MSARCSSSGAGAEAGLAMPCFVGLLDLGLNLAEASIHSGVVAWVFISSLVSLAWSKRRRVGRIPRG